MRAILCLALAAIASPAVARDPIIGPKAHYYGPLQKWHGAGYKHEVRKDGTWRVVADSRMLDGEGFALNVVMYRAAELAREQGFPYIQMLAANQVGSRLYGNQTAVLIARPSASPAPPTGCKPGRCYTADVARVLALLGGPAGDRPGIAVPSYLDEYGRQVTITGFGIGAVSPDGVVRTAPLPKGARPIQAAPPFAVVEPMPFAAPIMARASQYPPPPRRALPADAPTYEDRLKAAQPVRGGDARQGWTISD